MLNLKFKIYSELLVGDIREGVNHLSMSKLNLKFKIFSELLVSDIGGVNHLSMSRLNLKLKISSQLLVGDIREGVNHLSMSKLNLKFKIYSEILVSDKAGPITFPCQGWILISKFTVSYWSVIWGVNHLSVSRLNIKFKIYSELCVSNMGGQSSFLVHAQILNL